ncbi:vesicular glutamate transporter 3-like isoform X1 [Rhodnius prolixus]|uniref:vesicular glutamate transporter 3-like isoform X1 n=2 Tax=Rhodnius prolixus TaxID=13249 RepID=UPI003D18785E
MESTSLNFELTDSTFIQKPQSRFDIIFKKRYIHSAMVAIGYAVVHINRYNLSLAIVSMTDKKSSNENFHEFNWNEREKGALLSSFFWGYVLSQVAAGQIAQSISPKLLLTITTSISALLAAVSPLASYIGGWQLLIAIRITDGLCQGFFPPLIFKMASNWYPPCERSRLLGFALSGAAASTGILSLFGALAQSAGGWPSIFYVCALLTLLWTISWAWSAADSPATHKTISSEEKNYIETSLKNCVDFDKKMKTPWMKIFTSIPFWALIFTGMCDGFCRTLLLSEIPSLINGIFKVKITANGFLSEAPYYVMWLLVFPACWLADYLLKNRILSKSAVRKLWTTLSMSASCLIMLLVGFFANDIIPFMVILIIAIAFHAFLFSSYLITPLELASNFAGIIYALTNTADNLSAALAPIVTGMTVDNPNSMDQWWTVFLIMTCLSVTGNVIYLIFGSTDVQDWNSPE